jgi:anthranilate synthase component I
VKPLAPFEVAALSRSLSRCPDPVALYRALCDDGNRPDTLLLESADHTTKSGEKSLVMSRAALRLSSRDRKVTIEALSPNGRSMLAPMAARLDAEVFLAQDRLEATFAAPPKGDETTRLKAPNVLDAVRAAVSSLTVVGGQAPLPPLCAGSIAYDLLGIYESLPPPATDPIGWPDFELWLAEELVWIQHDKRRAVAMRYVFGGEHAEVAYHDATAGLTALVEAIRGVAEERPSAPLPIPQDDGATQVDSDDARYCAAVTKLKQHITAGDVFQIVPSRTFSRACPKPLSAYTRLRALNPSPYMFFLHGRAGQLFGASPESALTVSGERVVRISPIAGTRPRGRTPNGSIDRDLDARIEVELRLDEKEVAEHMMLVDLARNDVARVSRPGTRHVEQLLQVVRYSHVMHLVSLVAGELRDDLDALHAYVATMNMGTLVGAPKLRAASLLREHEAARRGPYGGAVGYFTADGDMDTCIVIRSAVVHDDVAYVRAGGGVVHDSDPQAEADETRRKAGAVLAALRMSEARD